MRCYDKNTGIYIADSAEDLLSSVSVSLEDLKAALSGYILSASGWRAVFAASKEDEDRTGDVGDADRVLAAAAASAFFSYLGKERPRVLLGSDARPTGRILTAVSARIFMALGADVSLLGISSAPEIMAYSHDGFDGFYYISASHNPVGHNGFKFGFSGGVLPNAEAEKAKKLFMDSIDETLCERMKGLSASVAEEDYAKILLHHKSVKNSALKYYSHFVMRTAHAAEDFQVPFGVVIDFNGSARSASIDIPFLRSHGADVWAVNSIPGQIAHAIVPEGANLETARKTLEAAHKANSRYVLGYMPDNDGDRGNFVYISRRGKAKALNAQEVFALVASIELSHAAMRHPGKRIAIAVNGPTSLLIDDIAARLGVSVFRSDIGEANVVTLSEMVRSDGYIVPLCGEGSNGGNITYPAKVRDPMNSVMTIAKLWSVPGLFSFMMKALGRKGGKVSIDSILSAFPKYYMTPAFSPDAVMRVKSRDWDALKAEYERILSSEIGANMAKGAVSYEIRQYEGSVESLGMGAEHRPLPSTGGYKVQFLAEDGSPVAYLWLSRSRTEPVCRVMVDVKDADMAEHDRLLSWQRSMVERADRALS